MTLFLSPLTMEGSKDSKALLGQPFTVPSPVLFPLLSYFLVGTCVPLTSSYPKPISLSLAFQSSNDSLGHCLVDKGNSIFTLESRGINPFKSERYW